MHESGGGPCRSDSCVHEMIRARAMESGDSASGNGEAAASGARTTVGGVPGTASPGPPRVHLIEADVQAAARIAGELPPDRFRASTSPSLAAGLAHLTSETADVVLLDLDLPDSKGVQTLERLWYA